MQIRNHSPQPFRGSPSSYNLNDNRNSSQNAKLTNQTPPRTQQSYLKQPTNFGMKQARIPQQPSSNPTFIQLQENTVDYKLDHNTLKFQQQNEISKQPNLTEKKNTQFRYEGKNNYNMQEYLKQQQQKQNLEEQKKIEINKNNNEQLQEQLNNAINEGDQLKQEMKKQNDEKFQQQFTRINQYENKKVINQSKDSHNQEMFTLQDKLQKQQYSFQNQNNMLNQQLDNLEQLKKQLLDKTQELYEERIEFEFCLSSYSKQIDNLKVKLRNSEIENQNIRQQVQQTTLNQEIHNKVQIINRQEQEIKELKQNNQEIKNNNYQQQTKLIQSEQQISDIQNKNNIECKKLKEQIQDLQKQLENLKQSNQKNVQYQHFIESKDQQIQNLNSKLNQFDNQMQLKEQECQTLIINNNQLKQKLNDIEQQLKIQNNQFLQNTSQSNYYQEQLNKAEKYIQYLNQIQIQKDNQIKELRSSYEKEKIKKDQLQSELTSNELIMNDIQQNHQNQIAKLKEQFKIDEKLKQIQNNNSFYGQKVNEQEQKILSLQQENSNLAKFSKIWISEKEQLQKQIQQLQLKNYSQKQIIQKPIQLEQYNTYKNCIEQGLTSIFLGVTGVGKTMLMKILFDNRLIQLFQPIQQEQLNCYFTDTESFDFEDIDKREDQIIKYRKLFKDYKNQINNLFIVVNLDNIENMNNQIMSIYKFIRAFYQLISIIITNFNSQDEQDLKQKLLKFKPKNILFIKKDVQKQELLELLLNQCTQDSEYKIDIQGTIFDDEDIY